MRFTCDHNTFSDAFNIVARVAGKNARPGLNYVKAELNGNTLTLSGTDLEQTIVKRIEVMLSKEDGVTLLPKDKIAAILSTIDEPISMHSIGDKIKVASDRSSWNVLSSDPSEFPECEFKVLGSPAVVSAENFQALFQRTHYAADASKKGATFLSGTLIECAEGTLGFTCIDGRRLSHQEIEVGNDVDEFNVICPMDTLKTIAGVFKNENILIHADEHTICFQTENMSIESRILEGNFPPWRNFKPKCSQSFGVMVRQFAKSISQAAIMKSDESKAVSVALSDHSAMLSGSHYAGDSSIPCDITWENGDASFRIDPNYIVDMMKSLGKETLNISIDDQGRAWVTETEDGFFGFVMLVGDGK